MIEGRQVIYGQEGLNNGCNFYRIRQPLYKIIDKDLFPCATSSILNPSDIDSWLDKADIIFTQAAKSEKFLEYMTYCKKNNINKKFVIDYDDDIFSVSPFNPSYLFHGYREVDITTPDGKTHKIRDGEKGFDIQENLKRLKTFSLSLKACDLVTTTSPVLAGIFKKFNKNVKVIKNFLDLNLWKPLPLIKDDRVRIAWQGGWSHFKDWKIVEDALVFVMNKYKNVDLVVMGTKFDGYLKNLPQDRIICEPWVDMNVYPHKFKTLNADIGLAPIENTEFNTCKSELKWEEYSALEIPTVASNIPPYNLNISDGKNGFLCSDTKEWIESLSKLVESKELRLRIGKEARKHIEDHYDIDKQINQYVQAFESLFKPELILV